VYDSQANRSALNEISAQVNRSEVDRITSRRPQGGNGGVMTAVRRQAARCCQPTQWRMPAGWWGVVSDF
jgi:hypothetical protein